MDKISYICSFLLAIIFVSCQKEETSYYISDLRVQRIEIEDSLSNDTLYYLLDFSMGFNSEWKVIRPWMLNRKPEEIVLSVAIEDSLHVNITEHVKIFDGHYGAHDYYRIIPTSIGEVNDSDIICCRRFDKWQTLIEHLNRIPHPYDGHYYSMLSVNSCMPLPAYFTLKLETREIRVKVNNTPVRYKVYNR